ncbi:MAG: hypothetical protein EB127_00845 [Alphaproteobacteria bacterium]|nr:hypothetical protein [Alphaproteobacteria bacterium]
MTENTFTPPVQQQPTMEQLMIQELQNRIGQLTSGYETQLAALKAQAMQEIQQRDSQIQELRIAVINARKTANETEEKTTDK